MPRLSAAVRVEQGRARLRPAFPREAMGKRKAPEKVEDEERDGSEQEQEQEEEQGTPYPEFKRPTPEECVVRGHASPSAVRARPARQGSGPRPAQAACRALAHLHGAPDNPFRRKELDGKDVAAVQSALGQVAHSQKSVMDSLVRCAVPHAGWPGPACAQRLRARRCAPASARTPQVGAGPAGALPSRQVLHPEPPRALQTSTPTAPLRP